MPSTVVDKASQVWESLEVVLNNSESQSPMDVNKIQDR